MSYIAQKTKKKIKRKIPDSELKELGLIKYGRIWTYNDIGVIKDTSGYTIKDLVGLIFLKALQLGQRQGKNQIRLDIKGILEVEI